MNVLLIENDELMARPLREAGYEVTVASSPAQARRLLEGGSFDAVVLGALHPESAGLRVCSDLCRGGAQVPILLVVEQDAPAVRVRGLDAGADDCVSLTCPFEELLARLRALVRRAASP